MGHVLSQSLNAPDPSVLRHCFRAVQYRFTGGAAGAPIATQ